MQFALLIYHSPEEFAMRNNDYNDPVWSKNSSGLKWHKLRFPRVSSNRFR